jgi:hypothetical protein
VIDKGFRFFWVFITYLMAVLIPRLAVLIPLVGVTSGTLCALVYPPFFQIITFWEDWKVIRIEFYLYIIYFLAKSNTKKKNFLYWKKSFCYFTRLLCNWSWNFCQHNSNIKSTKY